jgi:hypothetical protein
VYPSRNAQNSKSVDENRNTLRSFHRKLARPSNEGREVQRSRRNVQKLKYVDQTQSPFPVVHRKPPREKIAPKSALFFENTATNLSRDTEKWQNRLAAPEGKIPKSAKSPRKPPKSKRPCAIDAAHKKQIKSGSA